MKRILLSATTILSALALIGLGTFALFSIQGQITGNTLATGVLELSLNTSAGKPFSITGMMPGEWTDWEYMDIYNSGDEPFEAYMSFANTSGDATLYDNVTIHLTTSGWDSDCNNGDGGEKLIYQGLVKDYPTATVVSSIDYWHLANEDDGSGTPEDNIRAGWSERVCQRAGLSIDAPTSVMGLSTEFSEIVDGVQDND